MRLSRFLITGPITIDTPSCVIDIILSAHRIKLNHPTSSISFQEIEAIQIIKTPMIHDPLGDLSNLDKDELRLVASFVNAGCEWDRQNLATAFSFISTWMNYPNMVSCHTAKFGPISNDNPISIDACLALRLCQQLNIQTRKNTTFDEMKTAILLSRFDDQSLKSRFQEFISDASREMLIRAIYRIGIPIDSFRDVPIEPLHERLMKLISFDDTPITNDQAIAKMFRDHQIDISKAENPLNEYRSIIEFKRLNPFRPLDPGLMRIVLLYGTSNIRKIYNPQIPIDFYRSTTLNDMLIFEGFDVSEISVEHPSYLLQLSYAEGTFFPGLVTPVNNSETTLLEKIDELDEMMIVSYGSTYNPKTVCSVMELTACFKTLQCFRQPFSSDESNFSNRSINKLLNIALARKGIWMELVDVIRDIQELNDKQTGSERRFVSLVRSHPGEPVCDVLQDLLELGMKMRGWTGSGPYPLDLCPVDDPTSVDDRVFDQFQKFERNLTNLSRDIGNYILRLPLMSHDGFFFYASRDTSNGLSIGERLEIIKRNETIAACIRMSSRWLILSAIYYQIILGRESPFDPKEVKSCQ